MGGNLDHPSNRVTSANVEQLFRYHPPTQETIPKFEAINAASLALARAILENTPQCADQSAAIRWVTLARMQANAAIACAPREIEIAR